MRDDLVALNDHGRARQDRYAALVGERVRVEVTLDLRVARQGRDLHVGRALRHDEAIARAGRLASPTLVMHGSHDLMADLRGSRELVRGARAAHPDADIHLRIIDGAYHELLNEPEGPGLIRDIIIWLGEH